MSNRQAGYAICEVCGKDKVGVRVCEVLDPHNWHGTRVRACQPCRARRKLTPVEFGRSNMNLWHLWER